MEENKLTEKTKDHLLYLLEQSDAMIKAIEKGETPSSIALRAGRVHNEVLTTVVPLLGLKSK